MRLILVGPQEDATGFLEAMDLFVLPSHTEGLPLTVLEAMAAGRPVIATAVGGIPEAIQNGQTGFVVPPHQPRQLAEAVMALLGTPGLSGAMGEAGREKAETVFTLEREARETTLVYQALLAACSGEVRHVPRAGQR